MARRRTLWLISGRLKRHDVGDAMRLVASSIVIALGFVGSLTSAASRHYEFDRSQPAQLTIGGGFAEVRPDQVIVLADSAEHADEIDVERARKARERAQQAMEEGVPGDAAVYAQIEAALRRAQIRVDVSRRRRSSKPRRRFGAELAGESEDES